MDFESSLYYSVALLLIDIENVSSDPLNGKGTEPDSFLTVQSFYQRADPLTVVDGVYGDIRKRPKHVFPVLASQGRAIRRW